MTDLFHASKRRYLRKYHFIFFLVFAASFLLPRAGFTAGEVCSDASPCSSGEVCISSGEGASHCYKNCVAGSSSPTEGCSEGQTCMQASGRTDHVCCGLTGCPLEAAAGSTADTPDEESEAAPFVSITPQLNVDIPGVDLSPATRNDGTVTVSFIGEYISGAYRFAVGIVLIAAIIMVVWGGFRYLIGSGFEDVSRGKEIIRDAIAGMLIVVAGYSILYTINPDLVTFKSLQLSFVQPIDLDVELGSTDEVTADDADDPVSGFDGTGTSGSSAAVVPPRGACPISLTTEYVARGPRPPRSVEFLENIGPHITGSTQRQRVVQAATFARDCNVWFGACGNTIQTINEAAIGRPCNLGQVRSRGSIRTSDVQFLLEKNRLCFPLEGEERRDCKKRLRNEAYNRFRSSYDGWPDAWADQLQPGDTFYVFNAQSSGAGQHSAIFMGWLGGGFAEVVQGGLGSRGASPVRGGRICLKEACNSRSSSPISLTKIFNADVTEPRLSSLQLTSRGNCERAPRSGRRSSLETPIYSTVAALVSSEYEIDQDLHLCTL